MLTEKSETVKVVVRCRPLSTKEINEQNECITEVDMKAHTIAVCNPANVKEVKNFTFLMKRRVSKMYEKYWLLWAPIKVLYRL